jgi:DNA gyrase subunit B
VPRENAPAIEGDALAQLATSYLLADAVIERAGRLIDPEVLRAMLAGVKVDLADGEAARASAERLVAAFPTGDVRVTARYDEKQERHQLLIERTRHGNARLSLLDSDFLLSGDFRQIDETSKLLLDLVGPGAMVKRGEHEQAVTNFQQAMDWLLAEVGRSAAMQRYKGLGEMNPEQLWETTMDPGSRRLLKVQIEDGIAADEIFTKLMGDDVEPRRDFIERNALVARLDI